MMDDLNRPDGYDLPFGEHVVHIYSSPAERDGFEFGFLRKVWGEHAQVLWFGYPTAEQLERLHNAGFEPQERIASGELILLSPVDETPATLSQAAAVRDRLHQAAAAAKQSGFSALHIVGNASWLTLDADRQTTWLEIEAAIDEMISGIDCTVVCQYDRGVFPAEYLLEVLHLHRFVVAGQRVFPNPYHQVSQTPGQTPAHSLDLALRWLDIREQTEQSLQAREAYFRSLYEDAPLPYQSLGEQGELLAVNKAWCRLLGVSQAEVAGKNFGDFLTEEQRPLFRERFARFKQRGEVHGAEFKLVRADGTHVVISADGLIARDEAGRFRQTHCILQDLSDRIAAEQQSQENERLYQLLFENNPQVVLLIDPSTGQVVHANRAAARFYGYDRDRLIGMPINQINCSSTETIREKMDLAIATGLANFHFRHRLASGAVRDVEVSSGPIELDGKRMLFSMVTDVTEKLHAEEESQRLTKALRDRLYALTHPVQASDTLQIEDLFNLEELQRIQDAFAAATGVTSVITDPAGRAITQPSNAARLPENGGSRPSAEAPIMVGEQVLASWVIQDRGNSSAVSQFNRVSDALALFADKFSQLAVQNVQQARVIVEREQAYTRLARVNRLYRVLSRISQAAGKAREPQALYEMACKVLVEEGEFLLAWIGLIGPEHEPILPVAWEGEHTAYLKQINLFTPGNLATASLIQQTVEQNRLTISNRIEVDYPNAPWFASAWQNGFRSIACFPLFQGKQPIAVMTLYSSESSFFDEKEISLLEEVSGTLSFALESTASDRRRSLAEAALQESEEKFRRLFSSGSDAIFVFPLLEGGRPGNLAEVNPVASERFTRPGTQLHALTLPDLLAPEDREPVLDQMSALATTGHALFEADFIDGSGRAAPMEVNSRRFVFRDQAFVMAIARDITERKEAERQIHTQLSRLSALRTIDAAINSRQELPAILDIFTAQVVEQLGVDACSVLLIGREHGLLEYQAIRGFYQEPPRSFRLRVGESLAGRAAEQRQLIVVEDIATDERVIAKEALLAEDFVAYCACPLVSKGELLGVLEVFGRAPLATEPGWRDYLETLAGQAAIIIEESRIYHDLRQSNEELSKAYDMTIEGWARALDLRDEETEGHSRRVSNLTIRLARRMGISDADLVQVRRGALLHDIGKMGIPDRILRKPGKLDDEEWQKMMRHPVYAHDMLSPIQFLEKALEIPYCHHEKYDGTGYPNRLSGENIPLAARIFAVIDVWDALTSRRPYREAWSAGQALAYIAEQRGKHFDPAVVDAFFGMVQEMMTEQAEQFGQQSR